MRKILSRIIHLWYRWKWNRLKTHLTKEKISHETFQLIAEFIQLPHQPQLTLLQQRQIYFIPTFGSIYEALSSLQENHASWTESKMFLNKARNNGSRIRLDIWMEQVSDSPWYGISYQEVILSMNTTLQSIYSVERVGNQESYFERNIFRYCELLKELLLIFGEYYYE